MVHCFFASILLVLQAINFCTAQDDSSNIALGKFAIQSGTFSGHDASRAVDGYLYSQLDGERCSSVNTSDRSYRGNKDFAWWQVDLAHSYTVFSVTVYNTDDEQEWQYLYNFTVYVSNASDVSDLASQEICRWVQPNPTVINGTQGVFRVLRNDSYTVNCTFPLVGRYVTIKRTGGANPGSITLCEVELEGTRYFTCENCLGKCNSSTGCTRCYRGFIPPACAINIALGKVATQSGTYNGLDAIGAVDGYLYSQPDDRRCSSVDTSDRSYRGNKDFAWWQVDLGDIYRVFSVVIYNTDDAQQWQYLYDFTVYVSYGSDVSDAASRKTCKWVKPNPTANNGTVGIVRVQRNDSYTVNCVVPLVGQYVTIKRTGGTNPGRMTVCEVEVEGTKYFKEDGSQNVDNQDGLRNVSTTTIQDGKTNVKDTTGGGPQTQFTSPGSTSGVERTRGTEAAVLGFLVLPVALGITKRSDRW